MATQKQTFWLTCSVLLICAATESCTLVKVSGTMTKKTGEAMTDLSKGREDSLLGKGLRFGGKVNTAVGESVEDIATADETSSSGKSRGEQFIDANKKVGGAALGAVKDAQDPKDGRRVTGGVSTSPESAIDRTTRAQGLLSAAGYDPGPADGILGQKTKIALCKFQKDRGIPVTGKLDDATCAQLGM